MVIDKLSVILRFAGFIGAWTRYYIVLLCCVKFCVRYLSIHSMLVRA